MSSLRAQSRSAAGCESLLGSLGRIGTLKRAAAEADHVIRSAFELDLSKIGELAREDSRAIEAFGEV